MASQKINSGPMGLVSLLAFLVTTILANPVSHKARLPLQTGNSTVGTSLKTVIAGGQTQTTTTPEPKKVIDEHLSLILSVLIVVAVVLFAVLDRLVHKWRVLRRKRAHEEAEASMDEDTGMEATTLTQQETLPQKTALSTKSSTRDTGQETAENCKPAAARQTNTNPDAITHVGY